MRLHLTAFLLSCALACAGAPDVVVVLGCQNRTELAARVDETARVLAGLRGRARPLVVLSGGATLDGATEADVLAAQLERRVRERDVRRRFVRERRSLDTIGNALFTALDLRARGVRPRRVLVVTSRFHVPRAVALFRHALGPAVEVAAAPAGEPGAAALQMRRAKSENASAARARHEILEHAPAGDVDALERRVREVHRLYLMDRSKNL